LENIRVGHGFAGEVEALNTPTIRRLTPSCRQLPPIAHADQLDYTVFEDSRAVRAHAMRQQRAGTSHQHFQSRVLEYLEKKSWTGTFGVA
jgi:hypothetical protein